MRSQRQPMFSSLALFNYRLFAVGGLISNIGGWMAVVAQDWLVLTVLTDGAASYLGVVTGLQFLPVAILAPFAGTLADRLDKRKVLLATQTMAALTSAVLFFLVVAGLIQLWQVYLIATMTGATMAFDHPARQAFISEMVPPAMLPNAIGLGSASFNAARLIGPGTAGLVIGAFDIALAIAINAVSYLAVIGALLLMRTSELTRSPAASSTRAVRDGIAYVRKRPDIMLVLFIVFVLGTFGMNFQLTNALMATQVFGRGAEAFGLLGSILASGSLAAALMAARRTKPRLRVLLGSLGGFAVFTTAVALAPNYEIYAVLLVPVGLCALTALTTANSTVQLAVEPEYRGRVMALYTAIFLGGTPLGAPLIGWIGEIWGPRWTLLAGAIATGATFVLSGTYLLLSRKRRDALRPVWPRWIADRVRSHQTSGRRHGL